MSLSEEESRITHPVATMNTFKTKDGVWLQMLGLDIKKHLPKFLKALGIRFKTYTSLLKAIIFEVITAKGTKLEKFRPIFCVLNKNLEEGIGNLTFNQCKKLFEKFDVWYCVVNMPEQALNDEQAIYTKTFSINSNNSI